MAEKSGRTVRVEEKGDEYHLYIAPAQEAVEGGEMETVARTPPAAPSDDPLVLVVADNKMGRGDKQLGEILVRGFFHTLGEVDPRPDVIIFFNAGVWLTIDDSPVLDDLIALEKEGVSLLACGTCLDYFELKERTAVGLVSNMYDIAETMLSAGKVVTL
jgi:selenium metabolism protein YedF